MPEMAPPSRAPLLGHISKTGSGPLAGAHDCEIMAEQSNFKKSKDQLGSFIAFLPPRHEVSWTVRDRERFVISQGGIFFFHVLPKFSSGGESWP